MQAYATLVRPETILAWHRKLVALKYTAKRKIRTDGQKRMEVIRELCVKFAEENPGWGYGRIQGALANVGYKISGTTVGNILREKGIFPSPERGKQSNWKRFIRSHMDVTAVADFFTVEVWTLRGLVRYHVFFVMKLAQRQVRIVHIGCPQQNGYAESFVATIQRECLDHLILFGEKSLRRAVTEYVEHFHQERNHQGLGNQIPFPSQPRSSLNTGLIVKSERLGGLLKYYHCEKADGLKTA